MYNSKTEKYFELRKQYPEFSYDEFRISDLGSYLSIDFHYTINGLAEFTPNWKISKLNYKNIRLEDEHLNKLVFSLGMVELISYWKITCSPNVRIRCGSLSESQTAWWMKLYRKGLGEFFYTNGINIKDDFMNLIGEEFITENYFTTQNSNKSSDNLSINSKVLVPIGGGKDSVVTLELLKNYAERYCYIINPRKATHDTVAAGSITNNHIIIANRTLDENMLSLNKRGFLNGHTPFSALVAFSSVIAAYIHDIKYVALSNESSANESTVLDTDINHQYSKSIEFESDFISYEDKYIASGIRYFSLLRPLTEISIAKIFSRFEKYHPIFQSCNVGSKKDIWCGNCPKCLFVYIILSPFLELSKMVCIFGKDMLNDLELKQTFEKLIGLQKEKPFECVGSRDEVNAAIQEIIYQYESRNKSLPALLVYYKDLNIGKKYNLLECCTQFDENNHVPDYFVNTIKREINRI